MYIVKWLVAAFTRLGLSKTVDLEVGCNVFFLPRGKDVMVTKIGTVMGLEWIMDPDPSYVLTVDNLIKMLAIQMRFRWVDLRSKMLFT